MIPPALASALDVASAAARTMVQASKAGVICRYSWMRDSGRIATEIFWKKGRPEIGVLSEYRPKNGSPEHEKIMADVAIHALHAGFGSGAIWAGKAFGFWQLDGTKLDECIRIVDLALEAPVFLTSVYYNYTTPGREPRGDLLAAIARRLRRGQVLIVHEGNRSLSAHERMALAATARPAMAALGLDPDQLDECMWNCIHLKGLQHSLWRSPEGWPDVALFLAESREAQGRDVHPEVQAIVPLCAPGKASS